MTLPRRGSTGLVGAFLVFLAGCDSTTPDYYYDTFSLRTWDYSIEAAFRPTSDEELREFIGFGDHSGTAQQLEFVYSSSGYDTPHPDSVEIHDISIVGLTEDWQVAPITVNGPDQIILRGVDEDRRRIFRSKPVYFTETRDTRVSLSFVVVTTLNGERITRRMGGRLSTWTTENSLYNDCRRLIEALGLWKP